MGITIVVTMIDILLNVSLFLVMFSIWCQVDIEHLKRHLKKPKALLLWLLLQLTMPPLLAVLMIQLFDYEWVEALGVLLWAASSWWVTSAIVTNRAKGDTELSVSMTTLNSMIISLTTLPLLLTVWYLYYISSSIDVGIDSSSLILELWLYIVLPLMCALVLWYSRPHTVSKLLPSIKWYLKLYFATMTIWWVIVLITDFQYITEYGWSVFWIALIMIVAL